MQEQRTLVIRALLYSFAALLIWQMIAARIWPPAPPAVVATTQPVAPASGPTEPSAAPPTTTAPEAVFTVVGGEEPAGFTLGTTQGGESSPFRSEVRLTSRGAAIERLLLSDYKEVVDREDRYVLIHPVDTKSGPANALVLEKIVIDGALEVPLDQVLWSGVEERTPEFHAVTFKCRIDRQGTPVLALRQRYELASRPHATPRYDLRTELTIENLTDQRHEVRLTQRGPVGLGQAEQRADERRVGVGLSLNGAPVTVPGSHLTTEVSSNKEALRLFESERTEGALWWMAAGNKYFAAITTPLKADGAEGVNYIREVLAVDLDGDAATHNDVTLRWVMVPEPLAPNSAKTLTMEHYLGPQDKRVLRDERNPSYVRRHYGALAATFGGSWCTFAGLTEFMVWLLDLFYLVTRNYGLAIILLVVVVRALLHPVTKKTQVNMMKMQQSMSTLQPKIEEIKKRLPNDRQRQQQEIMEAYREAGVNPAGQMMSCLPMLLQMPIWVALYTSLNNNIAMRHEGFFWWIRDLTSPDQLVKFGGTFHVPLIGLEISSFNLLPPLMAVTMYAQQKLMTKLAPTPKSQAPASAQAEMMQKQMQMMGPIMSVMMAFIFYNMPSGLNLYIMTSSIGGALEQWRIRKHIAEEQARAKTAPPTLNAEGPPKLRAPGKPSWFERMAKAADEAQKLKRARK